MVYKHNIKVLRHVVRCLKREFNAPVRAAINYSSARCSDVKNQNADFPGLRVHRFHRTLNVHNIIIKFPTTQRAEYIVHFGLLKFTLVRATDTCSDVIQSHFQKNVYAI